METKTFLENVLGSDGYYSVLAFNNERRIQKFYDSIDAVIHAANNLDTQKLNTFYGLATFKDGNSRKSENVQHLKSFFLDLDCGEGKDYPNQTEAINALRGFVKTLSLPKPVMVSSGYGVHVYWILEDTVHPDEWTPVALQLKKMCVEHGLKADPAVTADTARVLRVPGTHNHKGDTPKQVKVLGVEEPRLVNLESFTTLLGGGVMPVPVKVDSAESALREALRENSDFSFKNILKKSIKGTGCAQIKNMIQNKENISEPLWRAGLSIAKFCSDKDKAVDLISVGHEGYSKELTQEKVDLIKGPYLCSSFYEHNPDLCADCPNFGNIKSPITLGREVKKAPTDPERPQYPEPYFRGANGGVYVRFTNADGDPEDKLIYHNDLYVVKRIHDVELGEAIVMRLHLPKDGVREFTIPLTSVTSKEELRKQLSMQGIAVTRMDELMQYTTTWVNQLQLTDKADEARRQFGWTDDNLEGFILGNEEIRKDSIEFNPPSTPTAGLFPSFEPRGTLEDWKETINFYNRDGFELHQFVVGTSFGSPLMAMSPINCAGLHIYSKESGVGKTTAMAAGVSVWGNPDDLIIHERDTFNTKMNRGEVYHNLPLYMDELTNTSGKELSNLAYQLTGGRQRGRMSASSNTERHRGDSWRLLAVTTGNTSMVERISIIKAMPKAEAQRIMECRVSRIHFETKEETDVFSACLQNNYGHAGKIYVQHIMNNLDEVKKLLSDVQARVDAKAGLTAENRYWSILVASTITGLMLAKRIGLVDYDIKKVFAWGIEKLKENKRQVEDMSVSVEETLNDYIHEHWSNVLWIKSTDDLRKQDGEIDDEVSDLIIPEERARVKFVARYETDLKRAYLVPKPLKIWCGEQQINYSSFVHDLKTKLGATTGMVRLSKGTKMALPATRVIQVDCSIENENKTGNTEST
jgi:hypothetical protein